MLLPVAVVVDDSVNHVARPIDIGLVAHHRDVVLAVLVALLVYLHRHPATVLDLANLVASAADDEFDLVGVNLERFRLGRGRVYPRGSSWRAAGTAAIAESTATASGATTRAVSALAATSIAAAAARSATGTVAATAAAASVSAASASAAVITALPIVTGTAPAIASATLRIVAFPPIRHGSVVSSRLNFYGLKCPQTRQTWVYAQKVPYGSPARDNWHLHCGGRFREGFSLGEAGSGDTEKTFRSGEQPLTHVLSR